MSRVSRIRGRIAWLDARPRCSPLNLRTRPDTRLTTPLPRPRRVLLFCLFWIFRLNYRWHKWRHFVDLKKEIFGEPIAWIFMNCKYSSWGGPFKCYLAKPFLFYRWRNWGRHWKIEWSNGSWNSFLLYTTGDFPRELSPKVYTTMSCPVDYL